MLTNRLRNTRGRSILRSTSAKGVRGTAEHRYLVGGTSQTKLNKLCHTRSICGRLIRATDTTTGNNQTRFRFSKKQYYGHLQADRKMVYARCTKKPLRTQK